MNAGSPPESLSTDGLSGSNASRSHEGFESFNSEGSGFSGLGGDSRARGATEEAVLGERGTAAVNRPASLQSRISNLLAAGLMGSMAVGLIGWYYVHSIVGHSAAGQAARTAAKGKAQGEIVLPPLGRIDPPVEHAVPRLPCWGRRRRSRLRPEEPPPG